MKLTLLHESKRKTYTLPQAFAGVVKGGGVGLIGCSKGTANQADNIASATKLTSISIREMMCKRCKKLYYQDVTCNDPIHTADDPHKVKTTMSKDSFSITYVIPFTGGGRTSRQGWGVTIPPELAEELYPYTNQIAKFLAFNQNDVPNILRNIEGNLKISINVNEKSEPEITDDYRKKGIAGAWRKLRGRNF